MNKGKCFIMLLWSDYEWECRFLPLSVFKVCLSVLSVRQVEQLEAGTPGRLKVTAKSTETDEITEGEYNTVSVNPAACFITFLLFMIMYNYLQVLSSVLGTDSCGSWRLYRNYRSRQGWGHCQPKVCPRPPLIFPFINALSLWSLLSFKNLFFLVLCWLGGDIWKWGIWLWQHSQCDSAVLGEREGERVACQASEQKFWLNEVVLNWAGINGKHLFLKHYSSTHIGAQAMGFTLIVRL